MWARVRSHKFRDLLAVTRYKMYTRSPCTYTCVYKYNKLLCAMQFPLYGKRCAVIALVNNQLPYTITNQRKKL